MMENMNNEMMANEVVTNEVMEAPAVETVQVSDNKYATYAKRAGLIALGALAGYALYKGVCKVMEMKAARDAAQAEAETIEADVVDKA